MKQKVIQGATQIPQACSWLSHWLAKGLSGGKPVMIKLSHESRSEAQNRCLWAILKDFEDQADYPPGSGIKRGKEQWKILFISAYKYDPVNVMPGMNGELVNIGYSTKALNKEQFSELIELIYAQGSEYGIKWSDPALKIYDEFGQ